MNKIQRFFEELREKRVAFIGTGVSHTELIGVLREKGIGVTVLDRRSADKFQETYDSLTAKGVQVEAMDALSLAEQAGSSKAVNIVLMGQLAKHFHIGYDKWIAAIEQTVKPQFVEMNKKAFELGYNA